MLALLLTACTPPGLPAPIPPSGEAAPTAVAPVPGSVVVGLESTLPGFNPHLIADWSPATQAVAQLVLPWPMVTAADGTVAPDPEVLDAVVVTPEGSVPPSATTDGAGTGSDDPDADSTDEDAGPDRPFTVTYRLDPDAAWSDGTPITAEDFSYLWTEMTSAAGAVAPAGYRLITEVRSLDAGKTVEVAFAEPFDDWRTLFSPLLPSHLVRDAPGGFAEALAAGVPVSGNRYKLTDVNLVAGQLTLTRNDKYWAAQPGPASVTLRLGRPAELLEAYRRGELQALLVGPDPSVAGLFTVAVPADRRVLVPQPATVQLVFDATAGPAAEPALRRVVATALSGRGLADAMAGSSGAAALVPAVTSQVSLPAEPGGTAAGEPATSTPDAGVDTPAGRLLAGDLAAARAGLAELGWSTDGLVAIRDGEVLRLRLGVPAGDPRLTAAAAAVQQQLGQVGIEVVLRTDDPTTLIDTALPEHQVDLALLSVPRGASDAVTAASAYTCTPQTGPDDGSADTASVPSGGDRGESRSGHAAPTDDPDEDVLAAVRGANLSGFCDPGVDALTEQALTMPDGTRRAAALAGVDRAVWQQLPVLPLTRPGAVFAVVDPLTDLLSRPHDGWDWTGPWPTVPDWLS
ncbi:ABC transporter family substrate-binding protein [Nakamurella leprariae]|uniref:ABC transporter family substrate-binding protein n=1 Tax=Nakamurella leprariae TaxID=2803911 RepID=A0A938Y923_9ACTN|nr:ABC transporter family substrate-binding protein [Nakamurella leprariae]MBM9468286.1 ABC transporter family substrate-binding protein [Nakamurella leprariae]